MSTPSTTDQPHTVTPIKRASRATRAAAQSAKPAPKTAAKKSATPKAAAPAKVTKPKVAAGPTTNAKHIVADAMVAACAKLAATWNPKSHGGVSQETATQLLGSWCNYAPLTTWDDRLGTRSGAGGRGAKVRKSA